MRLQGADPPGVFWTLRVCAYPWPLCQQLATALINAARSKVFAERAGAVKVELGVRRNASVGRKAEEDDCSSVASFVSVCSLESVLEAFEGRSAVPNDCAVDTSCVDLSFQKPDAHSCSNDTRSMNHEACEHARAMTSRSTVGNAAVRKDLCIVKCDDDDEDNKSFCSCFSAADR